VSENIIRSVTKRSGKTVPYNTRKIYKAIKAANKDAGNQMTESDLIATVLQVDIKLRKYQNINVETIQDTVENTLMTSGFTDAARTYVRYRQLHEIRRNAAVKLMNDYDNLLFTDPKDMDLKRDNANINTDAPMGIMLKLGTEGAKSYVDNYFLAPEVAEADREGYVHYHDKDFSLITFNCVSGDTEVVIKDRDGGIVHKRFSDFDEVFDKAHSDVVNMYGLETLSRDGKFTKIKKVMRRRQDGEINHITFKNGQVLDCTDDHQMFMIDKSVKDAKDLVVGDEIPEEVPAEKSGRSVYVAHPGKITSIKRKEYHAYVYDFETENHLFVGNKMLLHNCCQIRLSKLLKGGFSTGHGFLREPNSIRSASALACIAIKV
jgi:hypothetical protein